MSKKAMGLGKAHDHGAAMRASAEAALPEIMALNGGGRKHGLKPRAIPPELGMNSMPADGGAASPNQMGSLPPDPNSMPPNTAGAMKKGGHVRHLAAGGGLAMEIRKNGATPSGTPKSPGAPISPKVKSRGKAGISGG